MAKYGFCFICIFICTSITQIVEGDATVANTGPALAKDELTTLAGGLLPPLHPRVGGTASPHIPHACALRKDPLIRKCAEH